MKKRIFFFILLLTIVIAGNSQSEQEKRLERMEARLPTLQGNNRVTCLNNIARTLLGLRYDRWDSALYYSSLAIIEAKKNNFARGLFRAYRIYGDGNLQFQRAKEGERAFKLAIQIANELKDDTLIAISTRRLGQALWYEGKFQNAIDAIQSSIVFFEKAGEDFSYDLVDAYLSITDIYNDMGDFEKGFEFVQKTLKLSQQQHDSDIIAHSIVILGLLSSSVGDHHAAFDYIRQASTYLKPCNTCFINRQINISYGNLYHAMGKEDSALYFFNLAYKDNPTSTLTKLYIAESYLGMKKYDTALSMLLKLVDYHAKSGDGARTMQLMNGVANAYLGKKNYGKALAFAREGLRAGRETGTRQFFAAGYQTLSSIFKELKKPDSALFYFEHYARMKDSVITDQLKGKLFEFKRIAEDQRKLGQIELLKKEKLISQQQLKQNQLLRNILITGILFLVLLGFFVFRNFSLTRKNERLKNEKIYGELQHKAIDLEMQALRSQMNPHFIFNCLSSINRFILKNETEIASDYLTRFSRLIRLVLIHSQSPLILLKDEIEMLRLYLEMEQLRFKNAFDYSITYTNSIDPEIIFIPSLLLQPFCENAIWHGLMHKEGHGQLDIAMSMQDNMLNCTITDNGIGRIKASEFKSRSGEGQKSFGLKITAERLALVNKEKGVKTNYEIEDVLDEKGSIAGTKVILSIRYKEQVKEQEKQFSHTV